MGNGVICFNNLALQGNLTVWSERAGFEKKYLIDESQGNVWRSTTANSETITMDMLTETPIEGFVGLNSNLVSGDVVRVEASTNNFTSIAESENAFFNGKHIIAAVVWSYRYYRFIITKNTGDYYYQNITIRNNETSNLAAFQLKFLIDTATLISSGKLNINASNMRVLNESDNEINFGYIDKTWNTAATEFWVKIDILASDTDVYKFCYGKANWTTKTANLENVMEFIDEFNGSSLDIEKWTGGVTSIADGKANFSGSETLSINSIDNHLNTNNWVFGFYGAINTVSGAINFGACYDWSNKSILQSNAGSDWRIQNVSLGSGAYSSNVGTYDANSHLFEVVTDYSNLRTRARIDGGSWTSLSTNYSSSLNKDSYIRNAINCISDWEYVYVRKYTENEPTVTTGSEAFYDTGAYIELGEFYLVGSSYELEKNFDWPVKDPNTQKWNTKTTDGGQIERTLQFDRDDMAVVFTGMSKSQKNTLKTISKNPYIIFFPEGIDNNMFYGITVFSEFEEKSVNYWNTSMLFEENPA